MSTALPKIWQDATYASVAAKQLISLANKNIRYFPTHCNYLSICCNGWRLKTNMRNKLSTCTSIDNKPSRYHTNNFTVSTIITIEIPWSWRDHESSISITEKYFKIFCRGSPRRAKRTKEKSLGRNKSNLVCESVPS